VAIVGCGAIAKSHAAAIEELDGLELAAVVDTDPQALALAESEFGARGYASVEALLAEAGRYGGIEAACVCTPPASHRSIAEALFGSAVDVLSEKPLATSIADARAMLESAGRAGRSLHVSDKFRHVADLVEAGERLRAGEIGDPMHYAVSFCAPVDVRGRWPSDPARSGGGVLMDNGPHAFDVLSHVLDAPIEDLSAVFGEPKLAPPVEDTAQLMFRTESGTTGRIELSWIYFTKDLDYLVVQGEEGTIRVGWTGGQLRRHGDREWTAFGSGYNKGAAFRGVWSTFLGGASESKRAVEGVSALDWIASAYENRDRRL
jgi:predicted dehydrogenase